MYRASDDGTLTVGKGGDDKRRRTSSDKAIAEEYEARKEDVRRTTRELRAPRRGIESRMQRRAGIGGLRGDSRGAQGAAATGSGAKQSGQVLSRGGFAPPSKR